MLNPKEKKDVVFLQEYLENYPAKMGASANIMKKLFNLFQTCTGKISIPSYYRDDDSQTRKKPKDIFPNDFYL